MDGDEKAHPPSLHADQLLVAEHGGSLFRDITDKQIRRGVFKSVQDLETAIHAYIESHNDDPKPFIWTAKADDILAKVVRARKALNVIRNSGGLH